MTPEGPPIHFLNVEYFLRLLYETVVHGNIQVGFIPFLAHLWLVVTVLSILVSLAAAGVIIYYTLRMWQIEEEDAKKYASEDPHAAELQVEHSRWAHIQELIISTNESDWRQAIIEADIMLEDVLRGHGFPGDTVGDMLRTANPARLQTWKDAGEAHGVRNRIAHDGSAYQLTSQLAYRTIAHYEAVFREFGEL